MKLDRRRFLAALLLPALPIPGGRFVRNVPLGRFDGRPATPLGALIGKGLDARRFTDLALLNPESMLTPSDRFFVRTAWSAQTPTASRWVIAVGGRVAQAESWTLDSLAPLVGDAGTHLIECAGNSDPSNFGLMSAARWDGIPMTALLDRIRPEPGRWRVQVTGMDPAGSGAARSSVHGASWVFDRADLERTGAFLATRMNGEPLDGDHGAPVRLVVPGWYGCTCIKWVSRIDLVADDAPATTQMLEFAARTQQRGQPRAAADYEAPTIDLAATPVRVEQWLVDGATVYRVVGIVWGGAKPARTLAIRFRRDDAFVPVSDYQPPPSTATWALWSHVWRPSAPGRYRIALRTNDAGIRTRRLDLFFYVRDVEIDIV